MPKAISVLIGFIFISITLVIVAYRQEVNRLDAVIANDKVIIDSLKGELEIEQFDKSRYISIVEQVSTVNCKEVKEIIDGSE